MAAAKKIDWERIEPDWRAGVKSVVQIAADYTQATGVNVSHTAINKHFKQLGVPRDLNAKIMAKANAMVSASLVSGMVSPQTTASDASIINTNAMTVANVQVGARKRISRQVEMIELLTEQFILAIGSREALEQAIEDETADDKDGRRRATLMKAVSLSGHASTAVNLTNALKNVTALERQAYGIKDESAPENPLDALIRQVSGSSLPVIHESPEE